MRQLSADSLRPVQTVPWLRPPQESCGKQVVQARPVWLVVMMVVILLLAADFLQLVVKMVARMVAEMLTGTEALKLALKWMVGVAEALVVDEALAEAFLTAHNCFERCDCSIHHAKRTCGHMCKRMPCPDGGLYRDHPNRFLYRRFSGTRHMETSF